jgi:hypothetical protein
MNLRFLLDSFNVNSQFVKLLAYSTTFMMQRCGSHPMLLRSTANKLYERIDPQHGTDTDSRPSPGGKYSF